MKKLAFISDIHSNLPALKTALEDIKSRGIRDIYCLGDVVGYHTYPNEVIALLKESGVISIEGNHDKVINDKSFDRSNPKHFSFGWNYDRLTPGNLEFLKELPTELELNIEDVVIKLHHGSPESVTEYVFEDSKEMDKYLNNSSSHVLITAHTHLPYIKCVDEKWIINTGSVGKPKIGRPEITYIVLTVDGSSVVPEIVSKPYPFMDLVTSLEEEDFPEHLITAIRTGNP